METMVMIMTILMIRMMILMIRTMIVINMKWLILMLLLLTCVEMNTAGVEQLVVSWVRLQVANNKVVGRTVDNFLHNDGRDYRILQVHLRIFTLQLQPSDPRTKVGTYYFHPNLKISQLHACFIVIYKVLKLLPLSLSPHIPLLSSLPLLLLSNWNL